MTELSGVTPIGADASEPARARRFVAALLAGKVDADVLDDVLLVTSELVTNVVLHAGGHGRLRVMADGRVVRIEVDDGGTGLLEARQPEPGQITGRGLLVVDSLAEHWGQVPLPDGRRVWAELVTPSASRR